MRIVRVAVQDTVRWGVVDGDDVCLLEQPPYDGIRLSAERMKLADARLRVLREMIKQM